MTRVNKYLLLALVFILCLLVTAATNAAQEYRVNRIAVLTVKGAIGPATSDYLVRGIEQTHSSADLVILQMDTPGGLDKSMRAIIQAILNSDIPVVSYVYPQGARAASAGTYILYASHVAAMAPATNLGAATPVNIGTPSLPDQTSKKEKENEPADTKSTLARKQINDATAYIRSLAELRDRNPDWAEQAVRAAEALDAHSALEKQVIDLVAEDLDGLIAQLDGRQLKLKDRSIQLAIDAPVLSSIEPDWRNRFLSVIADPNVAYILMLIGIYGLILEFYNPGMGVPGVIGAISLFIALYAFQVLPINYAGMGLILLGIALIVAEAFAPSFGILGIGGIIAFVFGSIILMDTDFPAYQIALPVIAGLAFLAILILFVVARLLLRSRSQKTVSGTDAMIGELAEVISFNQGNGKVMVNGELWDAYATRPLHAGQRARVTRVKGLKLEVEPEDKP